MARWSRRWIAGQQGHQVVVVQESFRCSKVSKKGGRSSLLAGDGGQDHKDFFASGLACCVGFDGFWAWAVDRCARFLQRLTLQIVGTVKAFLLATAGSSTKPSGSWTRHGRQVEHLLWLSNRRRCCHHHRCRRRRCLVRKGGGGGPS